MTARLIQIDDVAGVPCRPFQPALVTWLEYQPGGKRTTVRLLDGAQFDIDLPRAQVMTAINKELDRETKASRTVLMSS